MTPVGILLCAGRGRRFDPEGGRTKLLHLLDGGEAVVAASARRLLTALPQVIAVVPPDGDAVAGLLREMGCIVTVCPDADSGMAASLAHGIRHAHGASGWLVALGDMPFVRPSTIIALADAIEGGASIVAPKYSGQRGNPVAFSSRYRAALLALQGDVGARSILAANPVQEIEVGDAGILRDIDTPSDLHQSMPSKSSIK
jgi:molybdenum cofactor cytidylyltransferase